MAFRSQTAPATKNQPIAPRPALFRQAVHWATDCFAVIKERERQFGTTGHPCRRKTVVFVGYSRFALAKGYL